MLARDLGIASVRQLGETLTPRKLNEWIAFYEVDSMLQREIEKGESPQIALEKARVIEELREEAQRKKKR